MDFCHLSTPGLAPSSQLSSNKIHWNLFFLSSDSIRAAAELYENFTDPWSMHVILFGFNGPLKLKETHMVPAQSHTHSNDL